MPLGWVWPAGAPWRAVPQSRLSTPCCLNLRTVQIPSCHTSRGTCSCSLIKMTVLLTWGAHVVPYDGARAFVLGCLIQVAWQSFLSVAREWLRWEPASGTHLATWWGRCPGVDPANVTIRGSMSQQIVHLKCRLATKVSVQANRILRL